MVAKLVPFGRRPDVSRMAASGRAPDGVNDNVGFIDLSCLASFCVDDGRRHGSALDNCRRLRNHRPVRRSMIGLEKDSALQSPFAELLACAAEDLDFLGNHGEDESPLDVVFELDY